MNIYFAHPITDYGTERQASAIAAIEEYLGDAWQVENPDQPHHQVGYSEEGMLYFERLAASCDAIAFMRFPDGSIGAGVGKEIDAAQGSGRAVYEYFGGDLHAVYGMPTPILSVEDTRAAIKRYRVVAPTRCPHTIDLFEGAPV